MSRHLQTEAFVVRAIDYGETDRIITFLTPQTGKITAIAKGAKSSRKRFGGGLDPYRKIVMRYAHNPNRAMAFLNDVQVKRHWPQVEKSYAKLTCAAYATELSRELAREGNPCEDLFTLLEDYLSSLSSVEDGPAQISSHLRYPIRSDRLPTLGLEVLVRHFELRLLAIYGAMPSLYYCHRSGTSFEDMPKLLASRTGEGLLAPDARRPGESVGVLEPAALEILHFYDTPNLDRECFPEVLFNDTHRHQAERFLRASFAQILNQKLKTSSMLHAVLQVQPPHGAHTS